MRVLFPFVGDSVGGSHIAAVRLISGFANKGVEPMVVLHEPGVLAHYLDDCDVPHARLSDPRYVLAHRPRDIYWQFVSLAPRLAWFLLRNQVDIVHVNDQRMYWTWLAPTLLARKKFLLHLRYLASTEHPTHLRLMSKAHGIVCDSKAVCNSLRPELRGRARTIPSSIDWGRPQPDRSAAKARMLGRLGCTEDTQVIGFFSNLIERKRPLIFVEAAAKIERAWGGPVAFVMYGDDRGNFRGALSTQATKLGIRDSLHIMGFTSTPLDLMAGCDLMMAPAVREPLGLTLLEGCFVGTPVIAADDAGHREIYGSVLPELLATPDDADDFSRRALAILQDSSSAGVRMGRARAKLARKFTLDAYADAIEQVYLEVLGRRRPMASS